MVYQDISTEQTEANVEISSVRVYRGALVMDRILSTLIDFLIFSPLIGLALSGVIRDLKTYLLFDENSNEAAMLWIFILASVLVISLVLQVLFTTILGGTPGQRFLALKVMAANSKGDFDEKPTFSQISLRYFFWWVSFLSFGIPFIEILGHSQRRSIHDRASETAVISFGKYYDSGPLNVETRFIRSWLQVFASLVFCFLIAGMFKFYQAVHSGEYSQKALIENQNNCAEIASHVLGEKRADQLLALLLSDENKAGCVTSEAKTMIWTPNHILRSWGYLILSKIPSDQDQADYVAKVCDGAQGSEPCLLNQFLTEKDASGDMLRVRGLATVSIRYLLLLHELKNKNYSSVFSLLNDLKTETYLAKSLEKINVKAVWEVQQRILGEARSRNPASVDQLETTSKDTLSAKEVEDILNAFKERYDIQ